MNHRSTRRDFVRRSGAFVASALVASSSLSHGKSIARAERNYKKAVKFGMVHGDISILDKFKLLKELGFDGVEMDSPTSLDLAEVVAARDETGLAIPGVVNSVHWRQPLSHPDSEVRAKGLAGLETALKDCKTLGGTTVLLVPAVVNQGVSYSDAYQRSQVEIRKVLPLAEELGIKIAFENVWNHFLLSPLEAARYVDEFESPLVGWYFDVGNIVNYGWPEHWVEALGKRIMKLDIKEFSRKQRDSEGLWKGFNVALLEGDCNWPAVMKALDEIGFFEQEGGGWGTAEIAGGDRARLTEIASRMDRIFAS